jgi:hypothetical protein
MAQLEHPTDVLVEKAAAGQRDERANRVAGVTAVREQDEIGGGTQSLEGGSPKPREGACPTVTHGTPARSC